MRPFFCYRSSRLPSGPATSLFALLSLTGCAPDWKSDSDERDASRVPSGMTAKSDDSDRDGSKGTASAEKDAGSAESDQSEEPDQNEEPAEDGGPGNPPEAGSQISRDAQQPVEATVDDAGLPVKDAEPVDKPRDASAPDATTDQPELPVDPCLAASCDTNASCRVQNGQAKCSCNAPFVGDGLTCTSCSTLKCGAHQTCKSTSTTASCECDDGYEKSLLSAGSCVDKNECLNPLFCGGGKACTNTEGGANCTCPVVAPGLNIVEDPGFEDQGSAVGPPWVGSTNSMSTATFAIGPGRTGAKAGRAEQSTGWFDFFQIISVEANTKYTLGAWYRTTNGTSGHIGVRPITQEAPFAETGPLSSPFWTKVAVDFDSGARTQLVIFGGTWAQGPGVTTWEVDDFSLQKLPASSCN